jgi:hypothetical protein
MAVGGCFFIVLTNLFFHNQNILIELAIIAEIFVFISSVNRFELVK